MKPIDITPEEVELGLKKVAVEFRPGKALLSAPTEVTLRALGLRELGRVADRVETLRARGDKVTNWDSSVETVLACLTAPWNTDEVLDALTRECAIRLVNTALVLTYGPGPAKKNEAPDAPAPTSNSMFCGAGSL